MRQAIGQVSAPFPVEPVGLGAKWEVRMPIQAGGMKIQDLNGDEGMEIVITAYEENSVYVFEYID